MDGISQFTIIFKPKESHGYLKHLNITEMFLLVIVKTLKMYLSTVQSSNLKRAH